MPALTKACLLVRPFAAAGTGNVTTAERLAAIFTSLGHAVTCVSPDDIPKDPDAAAAWVRGVGPAVVILLHATKSRQLLDDPEILRRACHPAPPAPIVLVLGGTDANVDAHAGPEATLAFRRRLGAAAAVVAFDASLITACPSGSVPTGLGRCVVIPQGSSGPGGFPSGGPAAAAQPRRAQDAAATAQRLAAPWLEACGLQPGTYERYALLVAGIRPVSQPPCFLFSVRSCQTPLT